MKTALITLALMASTLTGVGQGSINFQSASFGVGKAKYIYDALASDPTRVAIGDGADYSGRKRLKGTKYTAGLFVEKAGSWFVIATSFFRTTDALAGILVGTSVLRPVGIKPGEWVVLQIRVWDSRFSSWDEAVVSSEYALGHSLVIPYLAGGGDNGTLVLQKSLVDSGLQSFGLFIIPEPSVLALGTLGFGAFFLHRRRR